MIPKRKGAQSINSSSTPDQASQVELSDIEDGSDSPSNLHSHGDNLVPANATAVVSSSPDDATNTTTMRGETTSQYNNCENAECEDELTIVTGCADTVLVKDGGADSDTVGTDCADTV